MQAFLLSILLVAVAQGIPSQVSTIKKRLPSPRPSKIITLDQQGLIIKWQPIRSDLEPVLGYKVMAEAGQMLEAKGKNIYDTTTVDGESVLVERTECPELIDLEARDGKLYEYVLRGADHYQMVIHDIKRETPYIYQILAFGPSGDGEPTSDVGIELLRSSTPPERQRCVGFVEKNNMK